MVSQNELLVYDLTGAPSAGAVSAFGFSHNALFDSKSKGWRISVGASD
jgi:hypothetical protein